MRLFLALGPGDIVGARRAKIAGGAINETSIAFSEQLFAYCRVRNFETLAISSHARVDQLKDGVIALENRSKPMQGKGGVRFHLSQIFYAVYLAARARQFGADIAVIDSGTTHYFALALFRLLGISVVVNLHNVLWPVGFPPRGLVPRAVRILNGLFFRYVAAGAIGVSPECERQVLAEARSALPFRQYRCQFNIDGFRPSVPYSDGPFRIVFVGRAEQNKGLLDLAEIATLLRAQSRVKVIFDVCGDGPALPELKRIVENGDLTDFVNIRGRVERDELLNIYARAHAAIVPTRSNFSEGMPQVCAEAVLSGLPVITSPVANAFDVIGPATIASETDNNSSYVASILSLIDNPARCSQLRSECRRLSLQFLDRSQSYPAAVDRVISDIFLTPSLQSYDEVFDS